MGPGPIFLFFLNVPQMVNHKKCKYEEAHLKKKKMPFGDEVCTFTSAKKQFPEETCAKQHACLTVPLRMFNDFLVVNCFMFY